VKRLILLGALLVFAVPASAARLPILASHDWWPVYSPDAQSVAFTRVNGQGRVFALEVVYARGGGRVVQLARASYQLIPSWSPDSAHLAYQSGGFVYTVARNGTDRRRVAAGGFPDWSPDGSSVAYVRDGVLRVTSKALATQVISKPDWSPAGNEIAFARTDGIYVVTLGGVERRVAQTVGEPSYPTWSYDGKKLAYDVAGRLYVVAADGTTPPKLVAGPYSTVSPPSWDPLGDAITYTADGQVRFTWLYATPKTTGGAPSEVGASFSPGDLNGHLVVYSALRRSCPGHSSIRVDGGPFLSGTCTIAGTAGADVIEGTQSWGDVILAGAGNDKIHAGDRHTDRIDCGTGRDEVWADEVDKLAHCEIVHR
jgi:Tol biopolymer transport system component